MRRGSEHCDRPVGHGDRRASAGCKEAVGAAGIGGKRTTTRDRHLSGFEASKSRKKLVGVLYRIVTLAGLDFVILVRRPDFELAEGAVFLAIRGRVADGILAAHLCLDLPESVVEGIPAVD